MYKADVLFDAKDFVLPKWEPFDSSVFRQHGNTFFGSQIHLDMLEYAWKIFPLQSIKYLPLTYVRTIIFLLSNPENFSLKKEKGRRFCVLSQLCAFLWIVKGNSTFLWILSGIQLVDCKLFLDVLMCAVIWCLFQDLKSPVKNFSTLLYCSCMHDNVCIFNPTGGKECIWVCNQGWQSRVTKHRDTLFLKK